MFPGDALSLVLLLLLLQHQLDEQLLQLLVAVVDTELLKTGQSGMRQKTFLWFSSIEIQYSRNTAAKWKADSSLR